MSIATASPRLGHTESPPPQSDPYLGPSAGTYRVGSTCTLAGSTTLNSAADSSCLPSAPRCAYVRLQTRLSTARHCPSGPRLQSHWRLRDALLRRRGRACVDSCPE